MRRLLDVLLPPACAGCGDAGSVVCRACLGRLRPLPDPATLFVTADSGTVIGDEFGVAIGAFEHRDPLRRALAAIKYLGVAAAVPPLADAALPAVRRLVALAGDAVLVPVPLHPERLRQRGYNQARLIADAVGSRHRMPVMDLLARSKTTERQHRLGRTERLRNLRGAFAPRDPRTGVPACAIVVDDILTTSATIEACAGVLRSMGVAEVHGFAMAREV